MAAPQRKYRFSNTLPTPMNPEGTSMWNAMGKMTRGVPGNKINELNWGESYSQGGALSITSGPARHFSGRGMFNRMSTLWCSYIINSSNRNIFYSGDSGYGPHFRDIGEEFGPFDHAFIECGQYNENWPLIHMMPEQTVQAAIDARAEKFTPVHWGKFSLSLHPWEEPVKRAQAEAERKAQAIEIPTFGAINQF